MSEPPAGPLAIEASVPVPNPDPTYIRVKLAGHADRLTLKIWSVGMQLLAEVEGGAASPGWSRIAMPDSVRHGPSGTYYYSVSASQGQRRAKSPPGRFVVLR